MLDRRLLTASLSLLFVLGLSAYAQADAISCRQVHNNLSLGEVLHKTGASPETREALLASLLQIRSAFPEDIRLGKRSPTWQDFDALKQAKEVWIQTIRKAQKEAADSSIFKQQFRDLMALYAEKDFFQSFSSENFIQWKSTDKDLLNAFAKELIALNNLLPKALQNSSLMLPTASEHAQLAKEGAEIVSALETMTDQLFSTSGFQDLGLLKKTIIEGGKEDVKKNWGMLENEDFEFAINRPENARWWIPRVGFHNQHVTGSSGGYKGQHGRNAVEATRLGISTAEYEAQDNNLKPKYGYLRRSAGAGNNGGVTQYGSDIYLLKKNHLRDRTTWTAGDSLNNFAYVAQNWRSGVSGTPTAWDHLFTPWSHRILLAPFLNTDSGNLKLYGSEAQISSSLNLQRSRSNAEYLELQYWGPIALDDVHAFIFKGTPPTGEFLKELRRRKIKVYQGNDNYYNSILWEPPK